MLKTLCILLARIRNKRHIKATFIEKHPRSQQQPIKTDLFENSAIRI